MHTFVLYVTLVLYKLVHRMRSYVRVFLFAFARCAYLCTFM